MAIEVGILPNAYLRTMRSTLSFLLFCMLTLPVFGQVTFHVVEVPASTPEEAELFISGDFEGWSGGSEQYKLDNLGAAGVRDHARTDDGYDQFQVYPWRLGSRRKGASGEEIPNRTYTFGGNGDTVEVTILNWADNDESTAADNVTILSDAFYMPQLDRSRRVWVYLPPGYEDGDQRYPVLYMHDGQNCFDTRTAFAGEWEVDETLNELYDEQGFALIVVAVDNGEIHRFDEYTPWINPQYGGGEGDAYIEFLSETLKPHIDSTYRTLPEKEHTGLMGSSLGGLISNYGALARPDVYGKSGVFSPAHWVVEDSMYAYAHANSDIDEHSNVLPGRWHGRR